MTDADTRPDMPRPKRTMLVPDGHPSDWIRVKDPNSGDYYTTTRALARRAGAIYLPDHDAVDQHGAPLPRKPHRTLSKES